MINLINKLFRRRSAKNPEDEFMVTLNDLFVQVSYPEGKINKIYWNDIMEIKLINTIAGPVLPDIWLVLIGKEEVCIIPHGARRFNEVYEVISKYDGFNFDNFGNSMTCTDNAEFRLWTKNIR